MIAGEGEGAGSGGNRVCPRRLRGEGVLTFPAWSLGVVCGMVALGLDLWGLNWRAPSVAESNYLMSHLGQGAGIPTCDLPWGLLVRAFAWVSRPVLETGLTLASALFGALGVGMLTVLMTRVGYPHPGYEADTTPRREALARWISGVAAGIFLATSVPYWWSSTRLLPETMAVVEALGVAFLFSWWQNSGREWALFLWTFAWGAGMAVNGSLWMTAPLGVALWAREVLRWRRGLDWRMHLLFFGGWILGMATLWLWVEWVWATGGSDVSPSREVLALVLLKTQAGVFRLGGGGMQAMLVLFLCVTGLPWWVLFVASHRSPWFYEREQVMLRVLLLALLVGILYNGVVAPWRIFGGLPKPMLMPTVLNAVCLGYLAGEFWILGERKKLADAGRRKFIRLLATLTACGVPLVELGAIATNSKLVLATRSALSPGGVGNGAVERTATMFADVATLEETVNLMAKAWNDPARFTPAPKINWNSP